MKIYANIEKPENLDDLIKKLYSFKQEDRAHCIKTYSNETCTITQCFEGKYRSFDDLLVCAQTYFPETTPKELFHSLLVADITSSNGKKLFRFEASDRDAAKPVSPRLILVVFPIVSWMILRPATLRPPAMTAPSRINILPLMSFLSVLIIVG